MFYGKASVGLDDIATTELSLDDLKTGKFIKTGAGYFLVNLAGIESNALILRKLSGSTFAVCSPMISVSEHREVSRIFIGDTNDF